MQQRFCHNCGEKLNANANFCCNCGASVPQLEYEPTINPSVAEETDVLVRPEAMQPNVPETQIPVCSKVYTLETLPWEPARVEVTPEPILQPQAVTFQAPKKGILSRRGAGRTILAILLCIVMFVSAFAAVTVLNVRLFTSGDKQVENIANVLHAVDLKNLPASTLILNLEDDSITLPQWSAEEAGKYLPWTMTLDPEDLKDFVEDSTVIYFAAEQVCELINDVYTGSDDAEITEEELEDMLEDNIDEIEDAFGTDMNDIKIEIIAASAVESDAFAVLTLDKLKDSYPGAFNGIRFDRA